MLVWLSGARCRLFAYGPADATASPNRHLLPHLNPHWFYPSGTGLFWLSWKRGHNGCSSTSLWGLMPSPSCRWSLRCCVFWLSVCLCIRMCVYYLYLWRGRPLVLQLITKLGPVCWCYNLLWGMRVTRVAVYRRYTNGLTEWTVNSGNTTLCVNQNVHILFLNNSMKTSVNLNRFDVHKWFRTYLPYLTKCHTVPCEMQSSCIWSKLCCFPPKSEGFSITSCFVIWLTNFGQAASRELSFLCYFVLRYCFNQLVEMSTVLCWNAAHCERAENGCRVLVDNVVYIT